MKIYYFLIFLTFCVFFLPTQTLNFHISIKSSIWDPWDQVLWSHWWRGTVLGWSRHTHTTNALDGQHHSTTASGARNVRWSQGFGFFSPLTFDDVDDVSFLYFFEQIRCLFDVYVLQYWFWNVFLYCYVYTCFFVPWWMLDVHYYLRSCWLGWICLTVCAANAWNSNFRSLFPFRHVGHLWTYRWRVAGGTLLTTSGWHKNTWTYWTRWDVFVNGSWWLRLSLSNPERTNSKSPTAKRSPTTISW